MKQHRSVSARVLGKPLVAMMFAWVGVCGVRTAAAMPRAQADAMAYLVNVTMRPGYAFTNAEEALGYGHGICESLSRGRGYLQLINDVKDDFTTSDDYQASYLISQSVNELCPALIWQLRNSAAHYRADPDGG